MIADVPLEPRIQAVLVVTSARPGGHPEAARPDRRRALADRDGHPETGPAEQEPRRGTRAQAVAAYQAEEGTYQVAAQRFGVPVGTLKSWVRPPAPWTSCGPLNMRASR